MTNFEVAVLPSGTIIQKNNARSDKIVAGDVHLHVRLHYSYETLVALRKRDLERSERAGSLLWIKCPEKVDEPADLGDDATLLEAMSRMRIVRMSILKRGC